MPDDVREPIRAIICPYCGAAVQTRGGSTPERCTSCQGFFEPLSRQATQNAMGPWQIRDGAKPFAPPCSFATIRRLVERGRVKPETIVRGPTTRQFWTLARDTPGIAALLGTCHACQRSVDPIDSACAACGAVLHPETSRQHLGLAPVQLLPGDAPASVVAEQALAPPEPGPEPDPAPIPAGGRPDVPVAANGPAPGTPRSVPPTAPASGSASEERLALIRLRNERRLLVAAAVVLGVVCLVLLAIVLTQWVAGASGPAEGDPARVSEGASPRPERRDASAVPIVQPGAASPSAADDEIARPNAAGPRPAAPPPVPAATEGALPLDPALEPHRAAYEDAIERAAGDTSADLEAAIATLDELAVLAEGETPLLDDLRATFAGRLEELRLRELLEDDG